LFCIPFLLLLFLKNKKKKKKKKSGGAAGHPCELNQLLIENGFALQNISPLAEEAFLNGAEWSFGRAVR